MPMSLAGAASDLTMTSGDLKPYRVEWRITLTTRWVLVEHYDDHDAARDAAHVHVKRHGGYTRVIAQHVIETNDPTGGSSAAH